MQTILRYTQENFKLIDILNTEGFLLIDTINWESRTGLKNQHSS